MGFALEDKALRRAGLDYHEWADLEQHQNYAEFLESVQPNRLFAFSTKGKKRYTDINFELGDALLFGPETRGLPDEILADTGDEHTLRLPMKQGSRSMNLSNSVAVVVYQAWSDQDFAGAS